MTPAHGALAKALAEIPEQQLANPDDPETQKLVLACAGATYRTGSLYLRALQGRREAARIGSAAGIMRWTRLVTATKERVQADAEWIPAASPAVSGPLPTTHVAGNSGPAGGAVMMTRGGWILVVVVAAAAVWGLAVGLEPEQESEQVESGPPESLASANLRSQPQPDAGEPEAVACSRCSRDHNARPP